MKKFLVSFVFVVAFSEYALYQYLGSAPLAYSASSATSTGQTTQSAGSGNENLAQVAPPTSTTQTSTPAPTTSAPKPTPIAAPTPTQQSSGQYVNGTYVGNTADAYYGTVQVQAIISGGKLTDVTFLQYPSDRSTSRSISDRAMPILKSEAIQAQSAQVDGVSGASDTSAAFQQSLGSALAQAKS